MIALCGSVAVAFTVFYVLTHFPRSSDEQIVEAPLSANSASLLSWKSPYTILWVTIHLGLFQHFYTLMLFHYDEVYGDSTNIRAEFHPDIAMWVRSLSEDARRMLCNVFLVSGVVSLLRPWHTTATLVFHVTMYLFICFNSYWVHTLGLLSVLAFSVPLVMRRPALALFMIDFYSLFSTLCAGLEKWFAGWPFSNSFGCFAACHFLIKSWAFPVFRDVFTRYSGMDVAVSAGVLVAEIGFPFLVTLGSYLVRREIGHKAATSETKQANLPVFGFTLWALGTIGYVGMFVFIIVTLQVPPVFATNYLAPILGRIAEILEMWQYLRSRRQAPTSAKLQSSSSATKPESKKDQ